MSKAPAMFARKRLRKMRRTKMGKRRRSKSREVRDRQRES